MKANRFRGVISLTEIYPLPRKDQVVLVAAVLAAIFIVVTTGLVGVAFVAILSFAIVATMDMRLRREFREEAHRFIETLHGRHQWDGPTAVPVGEDEEDPPEIVLMPLLPSALLPEDAPPPPGVAARRMAPVERGT